MSYFSFAWWATVRWATVRWATVQWATVRWATVLHSLLPYTYSSSLTNICVSCSISACARTGIQAFNVRIRMKNRIIPLRVGENRGQMMPSWRALTRGDIWRQDMETCGGFSSKKLRPISLSRTRKLVGASIKIVIYLRQYINSTNNA